jgi:HAD superfamily hydrolase (TIGR01549 family)
MTQSNASNGQAKLTGLSTVLFDLGDTLIHGNFTAGATQAVWEEVYERLILQERDPNNSGYVTPPLTRIREAVAEHVGKAMAVTWKEKTEEEMDILALFKAAFEAAGLPRAAEPEFLRQVISLEQELLYARIVEIGQTVMPTLETLRARGYRLGLVSNFCNLVDVVYLNLDRLGLLRYFDQTVLSCEIGWRKPSPRIYTAICEKLEVAPQECLFVGDRLIEDVLGPQKAGMHAVLTREFRQEDPTPEIQPDRVISRLDELLEFL